MTTLSLSHDDAVTAFPLLVRYVREPELRDSPDPDRTLYEWNPELTAEEQARVTRIVRMIRSAVLIAPDEWAIIEPDIDTLRAFRTRTGNPTNAQVVTAIDSIIDVLRVLLRD